jgi:hypothetical protein
LLAQGDSGGDRHCRREAPPPTLTASAAGGPAQPVPQRFCSSFRLLFPLSFHSPSLPSSTFHGRRQGSSKVAGGAALSSRTRDLRPTAPDLQPPGAGGARWLGAVADPLWPMAELGARRGSLHGHLPHGSAAPPCGGTRRWWMGGATSRGTPTSVLFQTPAWSPTCCCRWALPAAAAACAAPKPAAVFFSLPPCDRCFAGSAVEAAGRCCRHHR